MNPDVVSGEFGAGRSAGTSARIALVPEAPFGLAKTRFCELFPFGEIM
jgi:hypothetical protein